MKYRNARFGSVDSGVDEIKAGTSGMIAGTAITFVTSVWGKVRALHYCELNVTNMDK